VVTTFAASPADHAVGSGVDGAAGALDYHDLIDTAGFAIAASTRPSVPSCRRRPSSAVMMTLDWQPDALARLSGEAGEHHRMNGADPRAGQHA
jgi:hypothetical protein